MKTQFSRKRLHFRYWHHLVAASRALNINIRYVHTYFLLVLCSYVLWRLPSNATQLCFPQPGGINRRRRRRRFRGAFPRGSGTRQLRWCPRRAGSPTGSRRTIRLWWTGSSPPSWSQRWMSEGVWKKVETFLSHQLGKYRLSNLKENGAVSHAQRRRAEVMTSQSFFKIFRFQSLTKHLRFLSCQSLISVCLANFLVIKVCRITWALQTDLERSQFVLNSLTPQSAVG